MTSSWKAKHPEPMQWCLFAVAVIVVAIAAGAAGMCLALLLHFIQHIAFGYELHQILGPESFLQGVITAPPWRRIASLAACGAVAATGWWAIERWGKKLVSISASVGKETPGPRMPPVTTLAHAILQIMTVGMGSPLGREVAPREVGAVLADQIGGKFPFTSDQHRILIACGAGAGLAAVYNVPVAGALFILEALLQTVTPRTVIPALASCVIAAAVARLGLGNMTQYAVPAYRAPPSLIAWAIMTGPIFGIAAFVFGKLTRSAVSKAAKGYARFGWSLSVFICLGVASIGFPQILGNGRGPTQLSFESDVGIKLAAALLGLKLVGILGSLRSGAAGGLLTPGLTIGALIAIILAVPWIALFPATSIGAFAVVGAAAFLGSSMNMPLTAIALAIEFTHVGHDIWTPVILATVESAAALRACAGIDASRARLPREISPPAAEAAQSGSMPGR